MALDPGLGELVGNAHHQPLAVLLERRWPSPNHLRERAGVERLAQTCMEMVSQVWGAAAGSEVISGESNSPWQAARRGGTTPVMTARKSAFCRDFVDPPQACPQLWTDVWGRWFRGPKSGRLRAVWCPIGSPAGDTLSTVEIAAEFCRRAIRGAALYCRAPHEAHLSAKYPQAFQDARIPEAHEYSRGPGGAQAAAGAGPEAPVRIDIRDRRRTVAVEPAPRPPVARRGVRRRRAARPVGRRAGI